MKKNVRWMFDVAMTVLLLVLLARQLTGDRAHEWLGAGMFVLWILHHLLNLRWWTHLTKGRHTLVRTLSLLINLALFAVYLAGALLGPWRGALSLLVYLLLAAVGVPVMAGFRGGLGNLVGNTGGYVVGYIFAAFFTGLLVEKWGARFWQMCVAMVLGCAVCYFFGTLWYSILSGTPFFASFSACVVPFLPCDVVKILLAALLASRLRPALKRQGLL